MEWIQKGSKGDDVLEIQKKLQAKGFDPGPIDGIFGSKTDSAVRRFQEANKLQVDGIVGPETGGALGISAAREAAAAGGALADRAAQATEVKAKDFDPAAGVKAEEARKKAEAVGKKGEDTLSALKKPADEMSKDDAVEAVTDAMKGTKEQVEEEFEGKIGGSLWSRITGRNRNRDR
jgi:peptidoglycan hydrolase-like protein with peptidoglycan-binding domain